MAISLTFRAQDNNFETISAIGDGYAQIDPYDTANFAVYRPAGSIKQEAVIKFSCKKFTFLAAPTITLRYGYVTSSSLNIAKLYIKYGINGTWNLVKNHGTNIVQNTAYSIGAIPNNQDIYFKLELTAGDTGTYSKFIFNNLLVSDANNYYIDTNTFKTNAEVNENYLDKVFVANNYMSIENVLSNYMLKTEVEKLYTKSFIVNNLEASKGTFEDRTELKWLSVSGAIQYRVFRSIKGNNSFTKIADTINTYYQDKTGNKGTRYDYYVVANNASGVDSEPSVILEGYRDEVIQYPTNIKCSDGIYLDKVVINWEHSEFADRYKIYRKTLNSNDDTLIATVNSELNSYEATTATPGIVYLYYIISESDLYNVSTPSPVETGYCGVAKIGVKYGRFLVNNSTGNLILHDIGIPKN